MNSDLFGNEKMMALSWKNPFGTLMLHGKIETRTWPTTYRGRVLICVSKKPYFTESILAISGPIQYMRISQIMNKYGSAYQKGVNGLAIAVGNLVDCRKMTKEDEHSCFVQYHPDLWCHVYKDVRSINPFPWKGAQKWKKVNQSIIDSMVLQG